MECRIYRLSPMRRERGGSSGHGRRRMRMTGLTRQGWRMGGFRRIRLIGCILVSVDEYSDPNFFPFLHPFFLLLPSLVIFTSFLRLEPGPCPVLWSDTLDTSFPLSESEYNAAYEHPLGFYKPHCTNQWSMTYLSHIFTYLPTYTYDIYSKTFTLHLLLFVYSPFFILFFDEERRRGCDCNLYKIDV